jgi:hypothetical protein
MITTGLLSFFLMLQLAVPAVDKENIDVSGYTDQMLLVTDGKSHYVAVVPPSVKSYKNKDGKETDIEDRVFYGDGKVFYRVAVRGYGAESGKYFQYHLADPRFVWNQQPSFGERGGKYTATCGTRKTALDPVETNRARKMLTKASFKRSPHGWIPYALARNDKGVYYFVDRGRWKDNKQHFRVFSGPKGNLKKLKLKNIVNDSEGDIFSTPTGDLRLILEKSESFWVSKGKRAELTLVPVDKNVQMIYNQLGVYIGLRIGTPCDDL